MNKPGLGIVVVGILAAMGAGARSDPWAALRFLEGKWEGQASGETGKGVTSRQFRFDLNGAFPFGSQQERLGAQVARGQARNS